jgi:ABC-type multidrug transport system fused ATPase/permease subunit
MRWLLLVLVIFNLFAGLALLILGGQYLLSMYGLIDVPPPRWIGWFVDDLFGLGMSARSSQAVVWVMVILGGSMIVTSIDHLRIRYKS